jgi:LysM repeat protein
MEAPLLRLSRAAFLAVCCASLAASSLVACGGSDTASGKAPDNSKIPTATLPASLPEPEIINGGVAQSGGATTYTVKSGDTLAAIADRFGVSLDDLRAANPDLDPASLSVGDSVRLPALPDDLPPPTATAPAAEPTATVDAIPTEPPAPEPTATPEISPTPSSLGQSYVVQSGDIPVAIAERFGITVEALIAANPGINPNNLQVGQVLVIPSPEPPPEG